MRKIVVILGFGVIDGANCLNACDTPLAVGLFPPGTIAYSPTPVLPVGALGFLVIY